MARLPFLSYFPFEFLLKSGDRESTLGSSEPLQLSMRQCLTAFGHGARSLQAGLRSPEEEGGGRGEEEGGERGGGAWRGGGSSACASGSRDPRFSMGFPVCSRDLPERAAATAGLARRDSRGI